MADHTPNPFALLGYGDGDDLSKLITHRFTSEKAMSDHENQTDFSQEDNNKTITISHNVKQIQIKFEKKQKQKLKKEKLDDELWNYEKRSVSNLKVKTKADGIGKEKQHGGRRKRTLWTKHKNYWQLIMVLLVIIILEYLLEWFVRSL